LLVKTAASLLFTIFVGPPLTLFDPTNCVKTWLLQGHHSALDTKSKIRKITEEVGDMSTVWKLLQSIRKYTVILYNDTVTQLSVCLSFPLLRVLAPLFPQKKPWVSL
jgi:hypothetical protein